MLFRYSAITSNLVHYKTNSQSTGTRFKQFVASELNDPICHSDECQIGSFSSEATNSGTGYAMTMITMITADQILSP